MSTTSTNVESAFQLIISEDDFFEKYRPIRNHINPGSGFDDCMFEYYDQELAFVRAQEPNKVWTVITTCEGGLAIISGFHFVNRFGYLITEVSHELKDIEVELEDLGDGNEEEE